MSSLRLVVAALLVGLAPACTVEIEGPEAEPEVESPNDPEELAAADNGARIVAVTDQGGDQIRVFDPAAADWSKASAQKWAWKPSASNGFSGLTSAWGLPSDAKLRKNTSGDYVALVTDSRGLAAAITYPAGQRIWAVNVGAANNPHSIELLPDGNVAVAASTGGFVRIYAASQGRAVTSGVTFTLADAHGLHYDPTRKVLWALGGHELVELAIGGTKAAPRVSVRSRWALPTPWGHDLAPKLGDKDRLWITTNSRVYEWSKSTRTVVQTLNVGGVKSNTTMPLPSGRRVWTQPKAGCATTWCTDTVQFDGPAATRRVPGAQIYKARVWSSQRE